MADKPGSFDIMLIVESEAYTATGGTVDVTRWDDRRFAASFVVDATKFDGDAKIKVKGTIDAPCPFGLSNCKSQ